MRRAWFLLLAASLGAPPASTGSEPAAATATLASLRIEAGDGEYLAWADNRLAGPIEVLLTGNTGRVENSSTDSRIITTSSWARYSYPSGMTSRPPIFSCSSSGGGGSGAAAVTRMAS